MNKKRGDHGGVRVNVLPAADEARGGIRAQCNLAGSVLRKGTL